MKKFVVLLFLPLLLFSCKWGKKNALIKTWQAVGIDNPQMDSFFAFNQACLDTMGKGHSPNQNKEIYGTGNIDSLRHSLQVQLDSARYIQLTAVKNTTFTFRDDSVAVTSFSGALDSSKWYFDEEGALVLDEMAEKGSGSKVVMNVVTLNDTVLRLKFAEGKSKSTVTFRPEPK